MKKTLILLTSLLLQSSSIFAHGIWIETPTTGKMGMEQKIEVFFGEYGHGLTEDIDATSADATGLTIWVITPDQEKQKLSHIITKNCYVAQFTPQKAGVYHIYANNSKIEIKDWNKYKMGMVKPGYYAMAPVVVADTNSKIPTMAKPDAALNPLFIFENSNTYKANLAPTKLKVVFKNEAFKNEDISIQFANGWTKSIETNKQGEAEFTAPWAGKYVMTVHHHDKTPGKYNSTNYESSWHVAAYSFSLTQ